MKPNEARTVWCHATSGSAVRIVTCCHFVSQEYIDGYVTRLMVLNNTDLVLLVLQAWCSADHPDVYSGDTALEPGFCHRGVSHVSSVAPHD